MIRNNNTRMTSRTNPNNNGKNVNTNGTNVISYSTN